MKKWMTSKVLQSVLVISLVTQLSGCGTLTRGDSHESIYRGIDSDKEIVSNPFLWVYSLGIMPIFFIASMPVDAVVDTVLLPVDLAISHSKTTARVEEKEIIPVFAVNMTNAPDFTYTIKNDYTAKVLTTGKVSKIPQTGTGADTLDIISLLTSSHPSKNISAAKIEWQAVDAANILSEKRMPSEDLRAAHSIIALFMPCNKVMLINSEGYYYNADFIKQKEIQDSYQRLTSYAKHSQCAQASQSIPDITGIWK